MQWFYNMKLSGKLLFSHILVASLAGLIGIVGVFIAGGRTTELTSTSILSALIILVVVILVAIALSMVTAKNIKKPLQKMMTAAEQVADGDLDVKMDWVSKDEIGILMNSLQKTIDYVRSQAEVANKMAAGDENVEVNVRSEKDILSKSLQGVQETIGEIVDELNLMSAEHNAGDIDVVLPVEKFQGVYREMAIGINEMVQGHIEVKKKAMACVAEFSKGNFDAELEQFPGKKAFINDNIESLRSNVKHFIQEMNKMSAQHDAGDIDVVVPEEKFHGDFKVMAQGVNNMVQGHIEVKKKAMACVAEFSKGNFDAELEQFPGKKAFINENIEALRRNLRAVNREINELIDASNEGKLNERANVEVFDGDWAKLMERLNGLIDAIIEPIQEAAEVLEEMSKGNLQTSVKGNYKGDHAKIKHALNDSIETLYSYVNEISSVLTEMTKGNLNVEITRDYRGDFEEIKVSINNIINRLNDMINEINVASSQVATGSKQLSDSSMALSQGATEQASSIEELTASLEEISSQTQKNADSANDANKFAEEAQGNAERGNEQMQEMLEAMEEINIASSNISKVIKVIDDIAFQTNILALNAAVEAARAGQHGKGFAVVAEEVRNLAAKSADAAKETTDLIEGSIRKVEGGTEIANQTAAALNQIVERVAEVAKIVGNISTASNEQATAIEQINQGVMQISKVVQTNSATSQESAASSEELANQAELLKDLVAQFRLRKQKYNYDSYQGLDELNPEVLKKLERMGDNKKNLQKNGAAVEQATEEEPQIALSDQEFEKYS